MVVAWIALSAGALRAQTLPTYTADGIANAAGNVAGLYAPNTLIAIYGDNLGLTTRTLTDADIGVAGTLPTALPGTGLRVILNGLAAYIFHVSPKQVNALIPSRLVAGPATLQLERNGIAGPEIQLMLNDAAPALFCAGDGITVIAQRLGYVLATDAEPAHPGEVITVYATGLGVTNPPVPIGRVATAAAQLQNKAEFQVWLNGRALPSSAIEYVGVTPGYAGLFQINLRLPADTGANPEIRVSAAGILSPAQKFLLVRP